MFRSRRNPLKRGPRADAITIEEVATALTSPKCFVPKNSGQKVPLKELLRPVVIPKRANVKLLVMGSVKKLPNRNPSIPGIK